MFSVIIAGACAGLVSGSVVAFVGWQMVKRRGRLSPMARRLNEVIGC